MNGCRWLVAAAPAALAIVLGVQGCALFTCLEDACDEVTTSTGGTTSTSTSTSSAGGLGGTPIGGGGAENGAGGMGGMPVEICDPPCPFGECQNKQCQPECLSVGSDLSSLAVTDGAVFVLGSGSPALQAWKPNLSQATELDPFPSADGLLFASGATAFTIDPANQIACRAAFGGVCNVAVFPCLTNSPVVGGQIDAGTVWMVGSDGTVETTPESACAPTLHTQAATALSPKYFKARGGVIGVSGTAGGSRYVCHQAESDVGSAAPLVNLDDANMDCKKTIAVPPSWIAIDQAGVFYWRLANQILSSDSSRDFSIDGAPELPFDVDGTWVYAALEGGDGMTACPRTHERCRTVPTQSPPREVVASDFSDVPTVYFIDETELCRWAP